MQQNEKDNEIEIKEKVNTKKNVNWMIIYLVLFSTVLLGDIYSMIEFRKSYFLVAGLSIVLIIIFYLLCDEINKKVKILVENRNNQFENYMKSQKAIYATNKNGLENIENKIDSIQNTINESFEELSSNNKAIAKTVIKKNIEQMNDIKFSIRNVELKINSNNNIDGIKENIDKISEEMTDYISKIDSICDDFKNIINRNIDNNIEILEQLKISNSRKQNNTEIKLEEPIVEEPELTDLLGFDISDIDDIELSALSVNDGEINVPDIDNIKDTKEDITATVTEEPTVEENNNLPEVDLSDPNKQLSADEIAVLFASMGN